MDAKPSDKQKLVKDNTTPSKATSVENDKKVQEQLPNNQQIHW